MSDDLIKSILSNSLKVVERQVIDAREDLTYARQSAHLADMKLGEALKRRRILATYLNDRFQ